MPHECTNCGRTFPDGSKEMLSGCPECGGNKFKFEPATRRTRSSGAGSDASAESSRTGAGSSQTGAGSSQTGAGSSQTGAGSSNAGAGPSQGRREQPQGTASSGADERPTGADERPTGADERSAGADADPLTSRSWPGESSDTAGSTDSDSDAPRSDSPSSTGESQPPASRTESERRQDSNQRADPSRRADSNRESGPNTSPDRPGAQSGANPHADVERGAPRTERASGDPSAEDTAQADARSEMVSGSELPDHSTVAESNESREAPVAENPGFERLREELNDQFESIRIVRPGEYELNLMELYDREEYIISLREDGRYVIEMPEAWDSPDG